MTRRTPEPRRLGPEVAEEPTDLTEPDRHELVTKAAIIFGEEAARELAGHLGVPFEGDPGLL